MSLSAINSVAAALTQLEQQKATSAQSAEKTLVSQPSGQSTPSAHQLPQDTVSLSSTAQKSGGDVDHDGDSH
jgi:hypothetical protein